MNLVLLCLLFPAITFLFLHEEASFQGALLFISMVGLFFLIGAVLAALFARFFVRSVRIIQDGLDRVSAGDLDHVIKQRGLVCAEFMRLAGTFNDMTERLRSSREQLSDYSRSLEMEVEERTRDLQEAQGRLLQQAHEAGMAEMANGILHNIGNAITPAKKDIVLLIKRQQESPFSTYLQDIMAQTQEAVQASSVLAEQDKGRLLKVLNLLPSALKEEYDEAIEELRRIQSKLEQIEAIILLQMRYARLSGDQEEVDVNRIVEDALDMLRDSLEKRGVRVVRSFSELPNVRAEQAKLLQIFISLIKNACEAMDEVKVKDRQLFLATAVEPGPPDYVTVSIRDTGKGFLPEDSKKIFTFGYSTKDKGSGFGLHSCANYLRANRGSLSAQSDGLGKGAQFLVRLALDSWTTSAEGDSL